GATSKMPLFGTEAEPTGGATGAPGVEPPGCDRLRHGGRSYQEMPLFGTEAEPTGGATGAPGVGAPGVRPTPARRPEPPERPEPTIRWQESSATCEPHLSLKCRRRVACSSGSPLPSG